MSGTEPDVAPDEPRRRGGLWDAVDDIEHVVGQTEPATVMDLPPVRPGPPPDEPAPRDGGGALAGPVVAAARPVVAGAPPGPVATGRPSRLPYVAAGVVLLALAVATIVILVTDRAPGPVTMPGPSAATVPGDRGDLGGAPTGGPGPTLGVGTPTDAAGPGGTASPTSSVEAGPPPSSPPGGPGRLVARYATVRQGALGLSGYTGRVTITNPGGVTVSGWQVVITLPEGATVSDASGAMAEQQRRTVSFTPADDTRDVGGGTSVEFTFDVSGLLAGEPTGCAIDGHPCD